MFKEIGQKVFIIAEIGKNFIQTKEDKSVKEYLENAKALVDEAVAAGADAVKFQTHWVYDEQANIEVTSHHFAGSDRYSWILRNMRATPVEEFWLPLKAYCESRNIIFFSTPMSRGAAKILHERVGVDLWKIGSADILDFVMLDYIKGTQKPIILSSGMSTIDEIARSVSFMNKGAQLDIALLHCVSQYPCPPEDLNLSTIKFFFERFPFLSIGFSDHSIGIESSLIAVAMGARIVEKHFSMSRALWGSDHKVSLEPHELKSLVAGVRLLEKSPTQREVLLSSDFAQRSQGVARLSFSTEEAKFRPLFRKTLVAGQDIKAGSLILPDMLYAMRPQAYLGGMLSEEYEEVVGRTACVDIAKFSPITRPLVSQQ